MRLIFYLLILLQAQISSSQINGDFEEWWNSRWPLKWHGTDGSFVGSDSASSCSKSFDACSGKYSVLLKTVMRQGNLTVGLITQSFGINWRPEYLNFCYKVSKFTDDSAKIGVHFSKGMDLFDFYAVELKKLSPIPNWTESQIAINWLKPDIPDTVFISIIAGSGKKVNDLFIDNIRFSNFRLLANDVSYSSINIFVDSYKKLIVKNNLPGDKNILELYSSVGLLKLSKILSQKSETIDLNELDEGIYFVRVYSNISNKWYSKKIVFDKT